MHLSLYKSLHFFLKASPFHIECRLECRGGAFEYLAAKGGQKRSLDHFRREGHIRSLEHRPPTPPALRGALLKNWSAWKTIVGDPHFALRPLSPHSTDANAHPWTKRSRDAKIQHSPLPYVMSHFTNKWHPYFWHRFKVDRILYRLVPSPFEWPHSFHVHLAWLLASCSSVRNNGERTVIRTVSDGYWNQNQLG